MRKLSILAAASLAMAAPTIVAAEDLPGDATAGGEFFNAQCVTCHVIEAPDGTVIAGRNMKTGPNLYGVIGGPAAQVEGFKYGDGILEAAEGGLVWNEENLTAYLDNTTAFLREQTGSRRARSAMAFQVTDPQTAADVYAYLMSVAPDPDAAN